ncbi:MAG: Mur ligase family protein, partial [Beijerinckiaceae bacterium]
MKLRDLVVKAPPQYGDIEISGITADSREVKPGFLFVAVPGVKADGSQFITDAFQRGAAAIVSEAAATSEYKIPLLHVGDARLALSKAAAVFYPHQPKTIVAVTGTSGKTSVADFVRQIFQLNGLMSASIGTLGVIRSDGQSYGSLTTPDPVTLHATLQTLADDGVQHVAMEASSHGLDQKRLHGVRLTAAAFTNLGHDHLDYHSTVSDYLTAKMRLFSELLPVGSPAIINADSRYAADVVKVVESS